MTSQPLFLFLVLALVGAGTTPVDPVEPVIDPIKEGYAAYQEGRLDDALAWYRQALKDHPDDASLDYDLACLLAQRGQLAEARERFARLSASGHAASVDALGQVEEIFDHLPQAEASYRAWLTRNGDQPKVLWRLCRVLLRENKIAEARETLSRLVALDPTDAEARYHLGELELREGKPELAIHEFRQAVNYHPEYTAAWNGLTAAYVRVGALDEAESALHRARAQDPKNIHSRSNAALLAAMRGDTDRARQIWQALLNEYPDFTLAAENLMRLEQAGGQL